jgi:hypothetical protein
MMYLRSCRFASTLFSPFPTASLAFVLLASLATVGQEQPQATITIPSGTQLVLVLTHPVQSRHIRRGDDIYAQITAPVNSGDQMVIPPGTFVQGTVEKLQQSHGRGQLYLQSMAITFPDGYVAPIPGPITLESNEGYALKDPGTKRSATAFLFPAAGAGIGALIGHSAGSSQTTITNTLPPGCTGLPPSCLSSSVTGPGTKGRDTAIGVGVGAAAGAVASMVTLLGSRHFFLDVGTPVEMTLQQPITLQQKEVAAAVERSALHPVAAQPVAPRPSPPPLETLPDHGTCYTPGTPGTPPTVIPGTPGANGVPGPPTIIPGTPPTPGTPYPCP